MQTHESQGKLARLLDQQITRINQQQQQQQQANGPLVSSCQELLDKTNDLMNAVSYFLHYSRQNTSFFFRWFKILKEQVQN